MQPVWFITGTSRGLGRAISEYALGRGHNVVATARDVTDIQDFAKRYGTSHALTLALDVTDYDAAKDAVARAIETFGRIDIVVNNAGYADTATVEDSDMDAFKQQVETNFFGVVNVSKAVIPILRQQQSGHIFQISSIGGRASSPGLSAYQSAKWAVGGFSGCLAVEVASFSVRVTVLEPGAMPTEWAAGSSMRTPFISQPYKQAMEKIMASRDLAFQGKVTRLEKVGPVIWQLYTLEDAPRRLVLGADAISFAENLGEAQRLSDEKWRHVSCSVSE
ncbi:NAD(P)-binding protein [Polychaeton citri CBS 116435]|uniref:NAD(P)-binding protein n=1 Tax=Polychaeton citri CBS 116435 TaxID=1314669 RepID=A0A9P4PZF6_9PEZI|nr:NAD(P)-binding protein [Polychaeton citri CBS 116435]